MMRQSKRVLLLSLVLLAKSSSLQGTRTSPIIKRSIPWTVSRGGSITDTDTTHSLPEWLHMDDTTLQHYKELAEQRHADAVKAAEESYYSYPTDIHTSNTLLQTLPLVHSYGIEDIPTWSLPDFGEHFNLSQVIHVTQTPLFTSQECNQVIRNAEDYFAKHDNGQWTSLPSGQYDVAGFWIKTIPAVHQWFNEAIRTKLFPLIQRQFPHLCCAEDLVVDNAYLFKYTTQTGRRTDVHTDSGCLSFTIALNSNNEYEGGGTWFESLDKQSDDDTDNIVEMTQGMVTVRPGGVRHCGQAVTSGTRYIIGGFCMHRNKVEYVRMLLGLGAERALQGDSEGAEQALTAALVLNPKFDAGYANLASVLEEQGKKQQAKDVLEHCFHHVNRRNAEVAYSLGVLYLNDGEYEKCKACMSVCLDADDCDVESMLVLSQACAGQGDRTGEEEWLRRVTKTPGVPTNKAASAYCNLGVMKEGTDEEIELYRKGLELSPNHFELRYSLGSSLALQKQFEQAAEHFRVAAETSNHDPEQQKKALQLLYRSAVMAVQNDQVNPPPSQPALIERLQSIMGKENYERVAAMAKQH